MFCSEFRRQLNGILSKSKVSSFHKTEEPSKKENPEIDRSKQLNTDPTVIITGSDLFSDLSELIQDMRKISKHCYSNLWSGLDLGPSFEEGNNTYFLIPTLRFLIDTVKYLCYQTKTSMNDLKDLDKFFPSKIMNSENEITYLCTHKPELVWHKTIHKRFKQWMKDSDSMLKGMDIRIKKVKYVNDTGCSTTTLCLTSSKSPQFYFKDTRVIIDNTSDLMRIITHYTKENRFKGLAEKIGLSEKCQGGYLREKFPLKELSNSMLDKFKTYLTTTLKIDVKDTCFEGNKALKLTLKKKIDMDSNKIEKIEEL